ncbi:RluA family pseudouridine synthase [Candidatus Comchoanobacter bicostacola]|uniref:Pseudouridine synthase n=1 Tax=Candidatus Comchoanobacter bicostacola TaxID=2919598 RepID=A0ABY5DHN6_9GAMM|nr:RluA family pseudouridine synthase [Candidatus Comchoanobacter bicostacola]UTC24226.1 RluA family pseudouridine synthase [Candidatus Comchoanobacter bicostacola]
MIKLLKSQSNMIRHTFEQDSDKERLDIAIKRHCEELSRSAIQAYIKNGSVSVNQTIITTPKHIVNTNDLIEYQFEPQVQCTDLPEARTLEKAYEDEHLVVINKPAGLTVHPGAGQNAGTLLNALLHDYPNNSDLPQAGMVHRLDKDTTGLMIVAKTLEAHTKLTAMMQKRKIKRQYLALVTGRVLQPGTIDEPLARHSHNRQKFAVHPYGRQAITHFTIAERFLHFTLLNVALETGRTHQIRVHMSHIKHAIVGDQKYKPQLKFKKGVITPEFEKIIRSFSRQALHATRLAFEHPITKNSIDVKCPTPQDLEQLLAAVRSEDEAQHGKKHQ